MVFCFAESASFVQSAAFAIRVSLFAVLQACVGECRTPQTVDAAVVTTGSSASHGASLGKFGKHKEAHSNSGIARQDFCVATACRYNQDVKEHLRATSPLHFEQLYTC